MHLSTALDARESASKVASIVCRGEEKKYYRFRVARFYGGIVTADAVGCNLNCFFCWVRFPRLHPDKAGKFYKPEDVVERLVGLMEKSNLRKVRISGCEPTICKDHLIRVLELLEGKCDLFILETNGTLLDREYCDELERFKDFLHVRVCLKGLCEEDFRKITGCSGFNYQLEALENLHKSGIPHHVVVITDFVREDKLNELLEVLGKRDPGVEIEWEEILPYANLGKVIRAWFEAHPEYPRE